MSLKLAKLNRKKERQSESRDKRRARHYKRLNALKQKGGPVTVLTADQIQDQYGEVFDPAAEFAERLRLG